MLLKIIAQVLILALLAACENDFNFVYKSSEVPQKSNNGAQVNYEEPGLTPLDIYFEASKYVGLKEIAGSGNNPKIVEMLRAVGIKGSDLKDQTAWCAAFVSHVLRSLGIVTPETAVARDYQSLGVEVTLDQAQKGDLVILWREKPTSWKGHIGFYHSVDPEAGTITIMGGNQSNAVRLEEYPFYRVLTIRRVN